MPTLPFDSAILRSTETAAVRGDLEELECLTRHRWLQSDAYYDILKKTIDSGEIETARLLINRGCTLSRNDYEVVYHERDNTLLHSAITIESIELVTILVNKDISIDTPDSNGIPPLFKLVDSYSGDSQQFSEFLDILLYKNKLRINSVYQSRNFTILHYAAEKGKAEIIPLLLRRGSNIYLKSKHKSTALHIAAENGHFEVVKVLLANGGKVTTLDKNKKTPLCLAIESGDFRTFEILFRFSEISETSFKADVTPLHVACAQGNIPVISALLITNKYDLNTVSKTGLTALHLAAKAGHSEVASLLLARGAKCELFDQNNKTPLSYALESSSGNAEMLEILLNHIRRAEKILQQEYQLLLEYSFEVREDIMGNTVLHLAVQNDDKVAVELILRHRVCIEVLNKDGYTSFDLAVLNGSLSIISMLLQSRDNPKSLFLPKEDGSTPMHLAVKTGNVNTLKLFFDAGITADISKPNILTPLHIAVRTNNEEVVKMLLRNGAKFDAPGGSVLETALFAAAEAGSSKVLEVFLEASSVKFIKSKDVHLLMYIAAFEGHESVVELLLKKGANPNANVDKYLTPLHAAAQNGHENIVRLLLKFKVQVNPRRRNGMQYFSTPLIAAAYAGHNKIVKLLLLYGADANAQLLSDLDVSMPREINLSDSVLDQSMYLNNSSLNHHSSQGPIQGANISQFDLCPSSKFEKILMFGTYSESEVGHKGTLLGFTALHFAVEAEDEDSVKLLLNYGANVNIRTNLHATVIGLAVEKENKAIIEQLFFTNVNIKAHHRRKSIFQISCLKNNLEIVEMLLQYVCFYQNHMEAEGYIVSLRIAIENELIACVEKLLKVRFDVPLVHRGKPLLHIAITKKSIVNKHVIVSLLLKDRVYLYKTLFMALLIAIYNGEAKVVKVLLDRGVNPDLFNEFSETSPLQISILLNKHEIVELLLKKNLINFSFRSLFCMAIRRSCTEIVQNFINLGVSINARDKEGQYPIIQATLAGNIKTVSLLLANGASLRVRESGNNVLHVIFNSTLTWQIKTALFQILVEYGADINAQDTMGFSPLELLFTLDFNQTLMKEKKYRNLYLKYAFHKGNKCNYPNKRTRESLLQLAIAKQDVESIRILLSNITDVDIINCSEDNPIKMSIKTVLRNSDNLRAITCLLVQEIARRLSLNKHIGKESFTVSTHLKQYYHVCRMEMQLMKLVKICEGVSMFSILVADYKKLLTLCRRKEVRLMLTCTSEIFALFPEYGLFLIKWITIGSDRQHLLNLNFNNLNRILNFNFPFLIVEHICSFLSNRDLSSLYWASNSH